MSCRMFSIRSRVSGLGYISGLQVLIYDGGDHVLVGAEKSSINCRVAAEGLQSTVPRQLNQEDDRNYCKG